MAKRVFSTVSFGERYMMASLIYIGIGLLFLSFSPPLPFAFGADEEAGCTYTEIVEGVESDPIEGCPEGKTCCGGTCIDAETSECCKGSAFPKGKSAVCGDTCINTDESECCKDTVFPKGKSLVCGDKCINIDTHGCCGGKAYNLATEKCCGNPGVNSSEPYYTRIEICCKQMGGEVVRAGDACCRADNLDTEVEGYSTSTQRCCISEHRHKGEVYYRSTQDCCESASSDWDSQVYHIGTQTCCGVYGTGTTRGMPVVLEKDKCDCCTEGTMDHPPVKACEE